MSDFDELKGPWDYVQSWDTELFGEVILDPIEQLRWGTAIMLGGLPYMWRKASTIRDLIYEKLELHDGDRVLLIGESIAPCGFVHDVRKHVGLRGEIEGVEIIEEARAAYASKSRGRNGVIATWNWKYTEKFADDSFDGVAVLQGTQHADDWSEVGAELVRVLSPGRRIVLAEIALGSPTQWELINADMHIEYWLRKMTAHSDMSWEDISYYSPAELDEAFAKIIEDTDSFTWKGIDVFWGRKPR